ncbi:MAG: hypothetical protein ABT20_11250 [Rubrivivax sp. SCN 70-15]|nr:MAG: hypothetical protein ABT20_11250 [Rubrivivax sp. SCN 70-15]
MGREILLTLLILLFGGLVLQVLALVPRPTLPDPSPRIAERRAWLHLWLPVLPMLVVGAWLSGWALREPDPVRAPFDHGMLIGASIPFALIALRATLRAAWVLAKAPPELPVCTAGLWRPRILFDPYLARALNEAEVHAALEHERAHARHRDPLRIWLAQLATDLQWPWPWVHRRFEAWLELLELARDDEARGHGASGTDLAAAVVATARHLRPPRRVGSAAWILGSDAALLGDSRSLQARIARLLVALPEDTGPTEDARLSESAALALLAVAIGAALALGAAFGNEILHPFLMWTWTV